MHFLFLFAVYVYKYIIFFGIVGTVGVNIFTVKIFRGRVTAMYCHRWCSLVLPTLL